MALWYAYHSRDMGSIPGQENLEKFTCICAWETYAGAGYIHGVTKDRGHNLLTKQHRLAPFVEKAFICIFVLHNIWAYLPFTYLNSIWAKEGLWDRVKIVCYSPHACETCCPAVSDV